MEWIGVPSKIEDWEAFVYEITHIKTGKKYIGKKVFWSKRRLKPLKGYKRKRIVKTESDWKTYWGSSKKLQADVKKWGEDEFKREIIHLCKTRVDSSYIELWEQIDRDVLFDDKYYNEFIGVKLNSKWFKVKPNIYKERRTI